MGLITGLLTFPLAPVRGTMLVARMLEREAESQLRSDEAVRSALGDMQALREADERVGPELEAAEDALLEELIQTRLGEQRRDGHAGG